MSEPPPRPLGTPPKAPRANKKKRGVTPGGVLFFLVVSVLIAGGVFAIVRPLIDTEDDATGAQIGDHGHAALGVDVCGLWMDDPPPFSSRSGTQQRAGLHSHGDGLIHLHPFAPDEAGPNATLGRFFEEGGWVLAPDRLEIWDDKKLTNGQPCLDGRPGSVRWALNGEARDDDPADYVPQDGDVIAIAFLPTGEKIGEPPSVERLSHPVDLAPGGSGTPGS